MARVTDRLTQKQVRALSRALKRQGKKLPPVGRCAITTKAGGKYTGVVGSTVKTTSEVCHYKINGKHIYRVFARRKSRPEKEPMWGSLEWKRRMERAGWQFR